MGGIGVGQAGGKRWQVLAALPTFANICQHQPWSGPPYLTYTLPYLTLPYLTYTLPYFTLPYLTLPTLDLTNTLPYLTLPYLTYTLPNLHLTYTPPYGMVSSGPAAPGPLSPPFLA